MNSLRKQNLFLKGLCSLMLIGFMVFFLFSHRNYMDLLEVADEMQNSMDISRERYEQIVSNWEQSYDKLQSDYGAKIVECEQLKQNGAVLEEFDFTPAEVQLLAECVQCEAGENNTQAQKYVCSVILNRVASEKYPNTIEEVVYQKVGGVPQFSVAYNGMIEDCVLSDEVLLNTYRTIVYGSYLPEYVLYFYSEEVDENWVNTLTTYTTAEGTVFAYE